MTSIHTASRQPSTESPDATAGEAVAELVPLDMPRDGVPAVIDTDADLARAARALAAGTGPASVDAERASGYRYGQRAFLVQIRREGSGTWLIDPEPFADLSIINDALDGAEWILHAASQDLACLAEVGLHPERLFDTELAARLAGLARVGLGPVVENLLGMHLAKEHSAADWSTRPLPEPWLRYAALDVEVLDVLREKLTGLLVAGEKLDFAREEFEAVRTAGPAAPRTDPWRRTSGVHQLRDRRQLAAVKLLWEERESLAKNRDVAPGRLIPDSALIAAARAMPTTVPQMLKTPGFHGRAAAKEGPRWLRCISAARSAAELPPLQVPTNAPPPPRVWADKDPLAAARLNTAKERITRTAEAWDLPLENLLTPDYLRRICWTPPEDIDLDTVSAALRELGARSWQIRLTAPVITVALLDPDPLPEKQQK